MSAIDELCQSYFDVRWHFDPAAASADGRTEQDGRLGRFDADAVREHLAAVRSLSGAAEELEVEDYQEEIDRTALLDDMRVLGFRFDYEQPHRRNPAFWLRHLRDAFTAVLSRPDDGAIAGVRGRAAARHSALPRRGHQHARQAARDLHRHGALDAGRHRRDHRGGDPALQPPRARAQGEPRRGHRRRAVGTQVVRPGTERARDARAATRRRSRRARRSSSAGSASSMPCWQVRRSSGVTACTCGMSSSRSSSRWRAASTRRARGARSPSGCWLTRPTPRRSAPSTTTR